MASVLRVDQLQTLNGTVISDFSSSGVVNALTINNLTVNNNISFPTWTDDTKPTTGLTIGTIGFNSEQNILEIYNGVDSSNNPIWVTFEGSVSGGGLPAAYQTLIDSAKAANTLLYVDKNIGSNSNPGTSESAPLASISRAVQLASTGWTIYVMPGRHINMEAEFLKAGRSYGHGQLDDYGKALTFVGFPGKTVIGDSDPYGCANGGNSYCGNSSYGPYAGGMINASSKAYGFIIERNRPGNTNAVAGQSMFSQDAGGYTAPTGLRGVYSNCVFRNITNVSGDGTYNNGTTYAFTVENCIFEAPFTGNNYSGGNSGCVFRNIGYTRSPFPTTGIGTISQSLVTLDSKWKSSNTSVGVYVGTYAWEESKVINYPGATSATVV